MHSIHILYKLCSIITDLEIDLKIDLEINWVKITIWSRYQKGARLISALNLQIMKLAQIFFSELLGLQ